MSRDVVAETGLVVGGNVLLLTVKGRNVLLGDIVSVRTVSGLNIERGGKTGNSVGRLQQSKNF